MTDRKRHGLILLLVAGLIAASAVVIATRQTFLGLDLKGGIELVYKASPTPRTPVNSTSLNQAVDIMRNRVDQLGVSEPAIDTTGGNEITVQLPNVTDTARAEQEVGNTANLFFYDWEANALTPNGKTVASQELAQNTTALTISQGPSQTIAPGSPDAGGMPLYQAVKLASTYKNPPVGQFNSRIGPQYYEFGKSGSTACQASGRVNGFVPVAGQYCYLSGPDTSVASLDSGLPAGVSASQGQLLTVPQGMVVLQAVPASFNAAPKASNPSTRFFTLLDQSSLTGGDITSPAESTDQGGSPDVTFGLTSKGNNEFQSVTATIAKRGQLDSPLNTPLDQHFAVALDTQLITVPSIDFKQYPDGIVGGNGSEITGGFTRATAFELATLLRFGPLSVLLTTR